MITGEYKIKLREDLAHRVVRDIDHILEQGWADEISREDLFHAHVCTLSEKIGNPRKIKRGVTRQDELDDKQVVLVYHSHELDGKASLPYRNIASYREEGLPVTIMPQLAGAYVRSRFGDNYHLEHERKASGIITVTPFDLGLDEWFDVVFQYAPDKEYALRNGRNISIHAALFLHEFE